MNYKQIIGVFSRKTQLKNVENIRLNDGKIEINFLKSIVRSISERCFRTEFSPHSRYVWNWNNVSIGTIARLLSGKPEETALLRAEILAPRPSAQTVRHYLADLLECPPELISDNMSLRELTLPVCGKQKNSYLTTLCWLEKTFDFKTPPNLIANGSVGNLIALIAGS